MTKYSSYLVCKDHINEVKEFLSMFFKEKKDKYNHDAWATFEISGTNFSINLMKGKDQPITKNMTFEIYCKSMGELEKLSKKHNSKIKDFLVTETSKEYIYNYIEIFGPENICKIEASYAEDKEK